MDILRRIAPDPTLPREVWNRQWEQQIARMYLGPPMSSAVSAQTMRGIEASANTLSMSLSFARKNVLDLQNDIALKAAQRLACDDLERKWTAFTPEERREYCLDGLYMASTQYGADLGFNRKWCPDLTLDRLSSTPTTYLSLLRRFVPEDLEHTITDLIVIEDAAVNRLIQNVPKIMVDRWQCDRMFYLSMVVWRILLAVVCACSTLERIDLTSATSMANKKAGKSLRHL